MSHASYLSHLFDDKLRNLTIKKAKSALRWKRYDAFLVSGGLSGMIGAILAHELNKKLVVARKEDTKCHSMYKVENIAPGDRLIFLDDLMDSGDTFEYCVNSVREECKFSVEFVGVYLYNSDKYYNDDIYKRFL